MNRNKPSARLLPALVILGLFMFTCHLALAQGSGSTQKLELLPEPPQQHLPWTSPLNGIDPKLVNDITTLFDLGMADPRGCDYRQIQIPNENLRYKSLTWTHGWVMPESISSTNRYRQT